MRRRERETWKRKDIKREDNDVRMGRMRERERRINGRFHIDDS